MHFEIKNVCIHNFFSNTFYCHCSLLPLDTVLFSKIAQSHQVYLAPALVFLTSLFNGLPSRAKLFVSVGLSVCVFMHARPGSGLVECAIPLTHLTQRSKRLQRNRQCMTKCPPWSCLNEADCSNEAGQTRQSTCGQGTRESWKRPGWKCQSLLPKDKETLCCG